MRTQLKKMKLVNVRSVPVNLQVHTAFSQNTTTYSLISFSGHMKWHVPCIALSVLSITVHHKQCLQQRLHSRLYPNGLQHECLKIHSSSVTYLIKIHTSKWNGEVSNLIERGLSNDPPPQPMGDCSWCFLGTVHLVLQEL